MARVRQISYDFGRTFFPPLLFLIVFSIILARLFYLMVLRGEYYRTLSDNNRTRTIIIPAPRGIIFDRQNRELVANTTVFQIKTGEKKKVIPEADALKRISRGEKVEEQVVRNYLYKDAFAHVLGYTGPISEDEILLPEFASYNVSDLVGKMGLEKEYENILHGENGRELFEVDAKGTPIRSLGRQDPLPGISLRTILDLDVQLSVVSAMKDVEHGAVVVSDPRNGEILALFSSPSFDANVFTHSLLDRSESAPHDSFDFQGKYLTAENIISDVDKKPLLNRAISGVYPPGSTFKLITAVAALSSGAIKKDTIIEDTGILKVGQSSFGNWYFLQYGKTEGPLDIVKAIARSNDIFFYKAAEAAGVENISSFAREFGFGEKFGIDIVGEARGMVPSPSWKKNELGEQWYLGDTYNYGIGQGYLLTTPLQVNAMTNVFANGGILYRPHLVGSQKKILKKNFIKKEYLELVRQGMRQSCEQGGVAWPFFEFKVKVGCKTGTAETGRKDDNPHAWITVFAPFYNPEIVVTVLVENGGEGSSVAGPIAKKILREYFERK